MKRILVIDDEPDVRETIRTFLQSEGFAVSLAGDGVEGLHALHAESPDLIIADFSMPRMNGLELLRCIRNDPAIALTPFILVTRMQEPGLLQDSLARGADNYLPKPFECQTLLETVRTTFERARELQDAVEARLDRLRRRLLGILSHEFLTPLNGIVGIAELMKDAELNRDEINVYSEILQDSGKRLHRLCENFLLCAQLEMATQDPTHPRLQSSKTSRSDASSVEGTLRRLAKRWKREADIALMLAPLELGIAENYLCKIVEELADNAFKFSKSGTPVVIRCRPMDANAQWTIEDSGSGIGSLNASSLGLFTQPSRERDEQQGVGLGVSIVRNLLAVHGGSLTLGPREGGGTLATVLLPISPSRQAKTLTLTQLP